LEKIRRICFFGGPGCGKSTTSAFVYAQLKKIGCNVELIQEYVKAWAYEQREVSSFDQVYLLAKQIRMEDLVLRNKVGLVVTDSPVLMSTCYAKAYGFPAWKSLIELADEFEKAYPSLNIFLDRGDSEYVAHGRYQTKEEAVELDEMIKDLLSNSGKEYHVLNFRDLDKVLKIVFDSIDIR
jgi:adenylate kinase family enzyme